MKKSVRILLIVSCVILLVCNVTMLKKLKDEKNNTKAVDNIINDKNSNSNKGSNGNKDSNDNQNNNDNQGNSGEISKMRITLADGFYYEPISDEIKQRITGKSYKENDKLDYSDLRYIRVKYIDFNGNEQSGELIMNVRVADDILEIFKELYDNRYQIEKMHLIDDYNADDEASMADNNTSAFNYRTIDGTDTISDHGYGIAIDINPLYNPYVRNGFGGRNILPVNGGTYADRNKDFAHKIVSGDICYNAFISRGFKWGGEWDTTKDYQHFYKEIE